MLAFLFEQYGYYPINFKDNTFTVDEWTFKLIEIDDEEQYVAKIDEYMGIIRNKFEDCAIYLMKTRFNKNVCIYDNRKYVLISVLQKKLEFKDLYKFHCVLLENDKKLDLTNLLKLWKERVDFIENQGLGSLRVDSVHHNNNLEVAMYSLGLAQNALQYLSEIILDFGNYLDGLTLVHKRINNLDTLEFFNPFNLIVDHPLKDLCELYKSDFLSFEELEEKLELYNWDSKLSSVFIARLLYPNKIFDMLEQNFLNKNASFNIQFNIEKETMKLKKAYLYFKQVYNIRPIDWLGH